MTNPMIRIHNSETDKVITREMNATEFAQYRADQEASATAHAEQIAEAEAKATARASALAKLAALGLSAEEIAAL